MNRQCGIDFARLLAAYCVAFGHLAFGGTFAVDEAYQRWTVKGGVLPLLDKERQNLWWLDYFLLVNWQTSAGIMGVGLFFVISGWVVPPMLKKYNAAQFLANRALRIFPMLFVSVLFAALLQFCFAARDTLSGPAVLSTMFLMNDVSGHPYTLGVVWTLVIEFKFYLLLAVFGQLTNRKVFAIVGLVAALCACYFALLQIGLLRSNSRMMQISSSVIMDLHYIVLMLVGASLYIALNDNPKPWYWRAASPVFMVLAFNLIRQVVVHDLGIRPWQDINALTQASIVLFFLCCLGMQKYVKNNLFVRFIQRISDITYSLYLLHLSIGILLLSVLREQIPNQYLLVFLVMLIVSALSFGCFHGIEKRCKYKFKVKEVPNI